MPETISPTQNPSDADSRTIRILVFVMSLLLFTTATILVIFNKEITAVSAVYGAAILCLIFTFLPMFKSFKAFGVEAQLNEQNRKIEDQEIKINDQMEVIRLIYEALKRSLTQYELKHLEELESPGEIICTFSDFLESEIVRLCQHGFVKETFDCSVWKMREKGQSKFNLKEFIEIKEEGRKHLQNLRDLEELIDSSKNAVERTA